MSKCITMGFIIGYVLGYDSGKRRGRFLGLLQATSIVKEVFPQVQVKPHGDSA